METERFWRWMPRILAVGFIGFLALFALDVFGENVPLGQALIGLFIHLIPNWLLLIALAVAWRWRATGGLLFLVLGLASLIFYNTLRNPLTFLIVTLPTFVIGALFLFDAWRNTTRSINQI